MKPSQITDLDQDFESLIKLLQVMRNDPLINDKIITLLRQDSFQRRSILNYWLEQLRRQNAFENLRQALSCLFDDKVAAKVLKIISNRQI